MPPDVPERALSTRQVIERVSEQGTNTDAIRNNADCSVSDTYDGRKTNVTFLTRRITETTATAPLSESPSIEAPDEIDRGGSHIDLDSVFEKHPNVDADGTEVVSYRGVTDTEQIECPDCAGSGQTCTDCSGSGTVICSNCSRGTVEHRCGCSGVEKHSGYTGTAKARTGEILKQCTICGGDGSRGSGSSIVGCDACDKTGALVETCPNCGGDGVSRREDCRRCDGRGSHTCDRCDGSGDVDACETCEGRGEAVNQHVHTVTYELTQRTHTDADETVDEYADEIAWEHTGTETVTDGFEDLPVSLTDVTSGDPSREASDGAVDMLAANVEYYRPVLYEAAVTLNHPTAGTGGDPSTVSALVSESVIERDGTFKLRDERGFVGRYVVGSASALGYAVVSAVAIGFVGTAVISFLMAFLIDYAGVPNPAALVSHPFSSDIRGLFFLVGGAIAGISFVLLFPALLDGSTHKYYFDYESDGEI